MSALDEFISNEYVKTQIESAVDGNFTCQAAEESILRRMLKSQGTAADLVGELSGKDFSVLDYGRIFNAIQNVIANNGGVDTITVENALRTMFPKNGNRLVGVMVALTKYVRNDDDERNIADHVKIVKDLAARRVAVRNFEKIMADLKDPGKDIEATLTEMEAAAAGIDTTNTTSISLGDVLLQTYDYVERRSKGEIKAITTGISSVDRLIGGFFDGELTIIAARPSVGKTAFGLNVALAAAKQGYNVEFVSCEMGIQGLGQRLFSRLGLVDGMALRKGEIDAEMWSKMGDAITIASELPLSWQFNNNYIEDIVRSVNRKAARGEVDILVVDYLQFLDTKRQFREERHRISYISHALKQLARSANIPVITLAQVTREGEGVMPTMKMLKESGNIEQDADGIIFLHRPTGPDDKCVDARDKPFFQELTDSGATYLCIGVGKQRNGVVGQSCVAFYPAYMYYREIDRTSSTVK